MSWHGHAKQFARDFMASCYFLSSSAAFAKLESNRHTQIAMVFCIFPLFLPPPSSSFLLDTESLPFRAIGTVLYVAARNNILHRSGCTFCTATGLAPTCQLTVEEHAFHVESCVRFWSMSSVVGATATLTVNSAIHDNQPASNLA